MATSCCPVGEKDAKSTSQHHVYPNEARSAGGCVRGDPAGPHSPSWYHSARGCTLFRSGVTRSVHLRVTVSPSLRKVTPNFSKNWTSKCMYGITDGKGTAEQKGHVTAGGAGQAPTRGTDRVLQGPAEREGHATFTRAPGCSECTPTHMSKFIPDPSGRRQDGAPGKAQSQRSW